MYILFITFFTYLEIVFNISTTGCDSFLSWVINIMFSLGMGLLLWGLAHFIKKPAVYKAVYGVILSVVPLIYYAEFLIYRSFKVYYDVNTCINGAGLALSEFGADIRRLIFCFDGISKLVLFYVPLAVYVAVLVKDRKREEKRIVVPKHKWGLSGLGAAVVLYFTAMAVIMSNDTYSNMYLREYNYQSVVENLGLITGLRLDIKNIITGSDKEVEFETEEVAKEETEADALQTEVTEATPEALENEVTVTEETEIAEVTETEDTEETVEPEKKEPEEYGYNAFDIDYEKLAENASQTNAKLDKYVAEVTPSHKNKYTGMFKGKNLIFITAEAFSGHMVDRELTPTLYRLIHKGIYFEDFYQPAVAGTTGGEYNNIYGLIPTQGGKSMRIMAENGAFTTMGIQLDREGYWGKAYHNNSSTVYSRDFTHNRLGYSQGFEGVGDGMENYLSSGGFPASDLEMVVGTMTEYVDHQPFNVYYMTVSGHGQYGRSINRMSQKNWDRTKDLPYSDTVKAYMANNMELEDALTYLVEELERRGIADDTVICLSPDHFPYGLDRGSSPGNMPQLSELYGFNVETYLQRDSNSCIIWSGCLEHGSQIVVSAPTFSLDLLPTLSNLFGVEFDSRLYPGRDVFSDAEAVIFDGGYDWKTELGTYIASKNKFTPVTEDTEIPEGYVNRIKTVVRNKMSFCKGVLSDNYYGHVYSALEQ